MTYNYKSFCYLENYDYDENDLVWRFPDDFFAFINQRQFKNFENKSTTLMNEKPFIRFLTCSYGLNVI